MDAGQVNIKFQRLADFEHQFEFVDGASAALGLSDWFFELGVSASKETSPPDYIFSSANGGVDDSEAGVGKVSVCIAKESIPSGEYFWDLVGVYGGKRILFIEGSFTASQKGDVSMRSTVIPTGGLSRVSIVKQGSSTRVVAGGTTPPNVAVSQINYIRGNHVITPYDVTQNRVSIFDPYDADTWAAWNEAISMVKSDWFATHNTFKTTLSGAKRSWRVGQPLDFTNIRNPGMPIEDVTFYGRMNGGYVCEFEGINSARIRNFHVRIPNESGFRADGGILFAKADVDGIAPWAFPDSKQQRSSLITVTGYPLKFGVCCFSTEVFATNLLTVDTRSPELDSYDILLIAHEGTADAFIGGLSPTYATIPQSADGTQSNILHQFGHVSLLRSAAWQFTDFSISNSNPAVVTVNSTTEWDAAIAAGFANNDTIWPVLTTGGGGWGANVDQVVQTAVNISVGARTFQLSGVNSTSYGTSPTGSIANQNGPCMLLNTPTGLFMDETSYLFSSGSPAIVWDVERGGIPKGVRIAFHSERHLATAMLFSVGSTDAYIEDLGVSLLSANQFYRDYIFDVDGAGTIEFNKFKLNISSMAEAAPAGGIFPDPSKIHVRGADWNVPLVAAFQDPYSNAYKTIGTLPGFTGRIVTGDDAEIREYGGRTEVRAYSAVAVSHSGDTNETTLATISMPANYPGENAEVLVEADFAFTTPWNAGKEVRVWADDGTTPRLVGYLAPTLSHRTSILRARFGTKDDLTEQVATPNNFIGLGNTTTLMNNYSMDFTVPWEIRITVENAHASDVSVLKSYKVVITRPN